MTAAGAIEIAPAEALRVVLIVQHQGEGFLWVSLGGTPVVGDGIRIGPWETVDLAGPYGAPGNAADFYAGAVDAIFQGGGSGSVQGGGGLDQTVVWVFDAE